MFEEADNFADFFHGSLPYYILVALPFLIICSTNPVLASSEFNVQRLSQFDLHGVPYGCRSSALNLEAKSLHTWSTSRHCVVARFLTMTIEQFTEIRAKAGGLIMMLPEDVSKLSADEKQHIYLLEQAIMSQEISIPVYVSSYNSELNEIIDDITLKNAKIKETAKGNQRDSAINEIINSVSANGYQISVSGAIHAINKQSKIPIIQGELVPIKNIKSGDGNVDGTTKLPLIIVTAHMDTFGLTNDPLSNIDVAVLLSVAEAFSKIYSSFATAPKYRILFLLSESGALLNFQGMKKWLDSNLEENVQIQNAEFVLCIDGIGQQITDTLYMHVSKPPKDGSAMNIFYKQLKNVAQSYANVTVEGVHKKINLADVQLAWEHERFSMKRMPGFTVSSLKSHKDSVRTTMFKESDVVNEQIAKRNAKIIAEALSNYVYGWDLNLNDSNSEIFKGVTSFNDDSVRPWLHVSSMLLNNDVKNAFDKYLRNVKIIYDKPDPREPDFMFYEGQYGLLNVYSVKPAVFDLFLTFIIVAYLGSVYLAIILFPDLYVAICKLSKNNYNKAKVN